jgi:ceramide glucosyltransferase
MTVLVCILGAMCAASIIYWFIALHDLTLWMGSSAANSHGSGDFTAVTFLRPIKAGVPALREKLEALLAAAHSGDQVLFGVDEGSFEAELCDELRSRFSECNVTVVHCRAGAALNPKISKLLQMAPLAHHAEWILSDSEALLDRDFADALREEWRASGANAVTCPYHFVHARSWPQRLDAAAVLLVLWPGLAVVRARDSIRFTLGACTALRRDAVEAAGGWMRFADELAEDRGLGGVLRAAGERIRLSRNVLALESDPLTWREYWRHQRRVAVTYRVANPAGFAGMLLVQGVPASLLLWAALDTKWRAVGWFACGMVLGARCWTAREISRRIGVVAPGPLIIFIASLVETACWFAAWVVPRIFWAGREWRIDSRGKLRPRR